MDLVSNVLLQSPLTSDEAFELVSAARQFALGLFPDKELAFEIIYAARFRRIIAERFSPALPQDFSIDGQPSS